MTLRPVLVGHTIRSATSGPHTAPRRRFSDRQPRLATSVAKTIGDPSSTLLTGRTITDVEARGKHLLIHLDDGRVIHSHLGMTGSWHLYRPGEAWRKPERNAHLALHTDRAVAVCFTPKELEVLTPDALRRHQWLNRLGPDILAESFDPVETIPRFRNHQDLTIAEALLHQAIASGIGNVYKSEVLFIRRISPFTPVRDLDDAAITGLLEEARALMRRNLEGGTRRTRFGGKGGKAWVYGRSGEPCLVCGTTIEMTRQGTLNRSTYWCGGCQGE